METSSLSSLNNQHIQWLSVLAFTYFQQRQFNKALPLLTYLHDQPESHFSIKIQLIQSLIATDQIEKAKLTIVQGLNQDLSDKKKSILLTLKKLIFVSPRCSNLFESNLNNE